MTGNSHNKHFVNFAIKGRELNMKKVMKKMMTVCAAAIVSVSAVSCGSNKKSGCDSPDEAMQVYVQGILDADLDDLCQAIAPGKLWDYACKESGLSKKRLFNSFLEKTQTLEDLSEEYKEEIEQRNIKINKLKADDKYEYDDEVYIMFGKAMSNAGIDEDVEYVYDVESTYGLSGIAYEIDGNWYFGGESIMEDLLETVCGNDYD